MEATAPSMADGRTCASHNGFDRRLVIFAGPGKTGSTSIQNTYIWYANGHHPEEKLPAFQNWTVPTTSPFVPYCDYMISPEKQAMNRGRITRNWVHLGNMLKNQTTEQNIFWPCEFAASVFDKVRGDMTIGATAVTDTLKAMEAGCPEIVINYRTPRVAHFISGWKERTQEKRRLMNMSVKRYVCDEVSQLDFAETTRVYGNPLRAAVNYRMKHALPDADATSDWPVTIIDMSGAAKAGRDVTNVIGCDILGVPCDVNGRVEGMTVTYSNVKKAKSKNGGLTDAQADAIEDLHRRRDCYYRDSLVNDSQVKVLHNDTLWAGCPDVTPAEYGLLDDDAYFMSEMKKIMGCGMTKERSARIGGASSTFRKISAGKDSTERKNADPQPKAGDYAAPSYENTASHTEAAAALANNFFSTNPSGTISRGLIETITPVTTRHLILQPILQISILVGLFVLWFKPKRSRSLNFSSPPRRPLRSQTM